METLFIRRLTIRLIPIYVCRYYTATCPKCDKTFWFSLFSISSLCAVIVVRLKGLVVTKFDKPAYFNTFDCLSLLCFYYMYWIAWKLLVVIKLTNRTCQTDHLLKASSDSLVTLSPLQTIHAICFRSVAIDLRLYLVYLFGPFSLFLQRIRFTIRRQGFDRLSFGLLYLHLCHQLTHLMHGSVTPGCWHHCKVVQNSKFIVNIYIYEYVKNIEHACYIFRFANKVLTRYEMLSTYYAM